MKHKITIYTLLSMLLLGFVSCNDDSFYDRSGVGEGQCLISGTVKFKSFRPALNKNARTPGKAMEEIKSLWVLLYDETGHLLQKYSIRPGTTADEGTYVMDDGRASFKLTVPYGQYYIYAVANMADLPVTYAESIQSVEGLKNISLSWKEDNIAENDQMFGYFFSDAEGGNDEVPLLTINRYRKTLQAQVRRVASKVTVAFDGSKLEEGVSIYVKSVTIKDIPDVCHLANPNTVSEEYGRLIETGESITYGDGSAYTSWPAITKDMPYYYYIDNEKKGVSVSSIDYKQNGEEYYTALAHGEGNEALFFFENMQGDGLDKRYKDEDEDGIPDTKPDKDGKPYGTYIEVCAHYNSDNPESLGSGDIKYRFMLGKNVTTNYDAERNHHYKLTLVFNRFANDPDWHIYKERYFGVTQPKVMNYQGKYFVPDTSAGPNLGHKFSAENVIIVTSFDEYTETGEKKPVEWTVEYREEGEDDFSPTCDWLTYIEPTDEQKKLLEIPVTFKASINEEDVQLIDIDENLQQAESKGSDTPYDLASFGGTMNTANCYIIDAKGTYMFPLVYGNAIEKGATNKKSYTNTGTGEKYLQVFKNHLGNEITGPYIKDNVDCIPKEAELVWQDEEGLVTNIRYDAGLYGEKGGIIFDVNKSIQGNAVIAIKDTDGRVMWSWHIWVTNFTGIEKADETIKVTNHDKDTFRLMPVNLGWCSAHGEKIKYYKEQTCEVKFTSKGGFREKIVTFVKKSHIAFPLGNNPYYQWGRKDPFVGTNANWGNKTWYDVKGTSHWQEPTRFYDEYKQGTEGEIIPGKFTGVERQSTCNILHLLIQNPGIWHNPPREENGNKYVSINKIYTNQWEGDAINSVFTYKTVYDPCPAGYQVSPWKTFTGFTTTGDATHASSELYNVDTVNIVPGNPIKGLYEIYTNAEKLQSIIFPESGYRDWDASAGVYNYYSVDGNGNASGKGFAWTAHNDIDNGYGNRSYHLECSRNDAQGYIWPITTFFSCDGFPIRPCAYNSPSANNP